MQSYVTSFNLKICSKIKTWWPHDLLTSYIKFSLDRGCFYYKTNPAGQARARQGRIWRLRDKGLEEGCTAKGKEGRGGKVFKLFVAIS